MRENLAASIPDVNFDRRSSRCSATRSSSPRSGSRRACTQLAVLHTPDADVAQHVAEGIRNGDAIADGSTLVLELDGGNYELDPAVDRHGAGTGMDPETFASRFGDGADDDALVRVLADDEQIVPGVRSAALELRLDSDAVKLRVRTRADESQQLEQILKALAAGGLHRVPATGTRVRPGRRPARRRGRSRTSRQPPPRAPRHTDRRRAHVRRRGRGRADDPGAGRSLDRRERATRVRGAQGLDHIRVELRAGAARAARRAPRSACAAAR